MTSGKRPSRTTVINFKSNLSKKCRRFQSMTSHIIEKEKLENCIQKNVLVEETCDQYQNTNKIK